LTNERDVTLAAVAKDAIQYGSYKTALDSVRQIENHSVRDNALYTLVRDALARGLYDVAIDAAAVINVVKTRNRALREISDQAKRFGLHEQATRAAAQIVVVPTTTTTTVSRAQAADATVVWQGRRREREDDQTLTTAQLQREYREQRPHTPHNTRSMPWVMATCGLTAGLWAMGFALHGHNLHEWLTTQIDGFSGTAFVMTLSSVGAVAYEWRNRRR